MTHPTTLKQITVSNTSLGTVTATPVDTTIAAAANERIRFHKAVVTAGLPAAALNFRLNVLFAAANVLQAQERFDATKDNSIELRCPAGTYIEGALGEDLIVRVNTSAGGSQADTFLQIFYELVPVVDY